MSFEAELRQKYKEVRARLIPPVAGNNGALPQVKTVAAIAELGKKLEETQRRLDAAENRIEALQLATVAGPRLREVPEPIDPSLPTLAEIIKIVSKHYGFTTVQVISSRRNQDLCEPRHVAMFLCRKHTIKSLPMIGKALGDRDHTTVMNGVSRISKKMARNPVLAAEVSLIERKMAAMGMTLAETEEKSPYQWPRQATEKPAGAEKDNDPKEGA